MKTQLGSVNLRFFLTISAKESRNSLFLSKFTPQRLSFLYKINLGAQKVFKK